MEVTFVECNSQDASQDPTNGDQDDLGQLIDIIQSYEYLYNPAHKYYKDIKKKHRAWGQIATLLNIQVGECQKYWKYLRDRFVKEQNKNKASDDPPESSWVYFNKMTFYKQYIRPRRPYITTKFFARNNYMSSLEGSLPGPTPSAMDQDLSISDEEGKINAIPSSSKITETKRKADEMSEILDVTNKILKKMNNVKAQVTPNESFGQYIIARLNEMSPEEASNIRKEIFCVLEKL